MKLYNLRWNPSISSFRDSTFRMGFERLIKGQYTGLNWSLWESEELEPGDWCLLSRVGSGSDDGVAVAIEAEVPEGALDTAAEAKNGCPVEAIEEA